MYKLGICYCNNGHGVIQDDKKALGLYLKSAFEGGNFA